MLSVIKAIKLKDQLEAMLAAQMAAVHMATMTFSRRLAGVENIPQQDAAERALISLRERTLDKWRRSNATGPVANKELRYSMFRSMKADRQLLATSLKRHVRTPRINL